VLGHETVPITSEIRIAAHHRARASLNAETPLHTPRSAWVWMINGV
jgi:hypothetical protein